jgi:hypothetical protein
MIGKNETNLQQCVNAYRWNVVPGYYHEGHPVLFQPSTGDLAWDGLADPYPIALPPAVEASIRARLTA